MTDSLYALLVLMGCMSALSFVLFGADKLKAKLHARRIPEVILLLCALIGGGAGALAGMLLFRHKVRKAPFPVLIPLFFLAQLGLLLWIWVK